MPEDLAVRAGAGAMRATFRSDERFMSDVAWDVPYMGSRVHY